MYFLMITWFLDLFQLLSFEKNTAYQELKPLASTCEGIAEICCTVSYRKWHCSYSATNTRQL